ncbi:MAG: hypothetical protein NTY19_21760 [Planctomycetota bacterium]|nr:hypothetical protein [Planctomycetota bacterium]
MGLDNETHGSCSFAGGTQWIIGLPPPAVNYPCSRFRTFQEIGPNSGDFHDAAHLRGNLSVTNPVPQQRQAPLVASIRVVPVVSRRACPATHDGQPQLPAGLPDDPDSMPDEIQYDETKHRLMIGTGCIDNVPAAVWQYEVSGKRVLTQWFSYRKKNRERPIIGDRRPPSKLGDIQPDHWLAEYTTELLNVLHVLALLVDMEPIQAKLLEAVCEGPRLRIPS